jgi:hypothetical protein
MVDGVNRPLIGPDSCDLMAATEVGREPAVAGPVLTMTRSNFVESWLRSAIAESSARIVPDSVT